MTQTIAKQTPKMFVLSILALAASLKMPDGSVSIVTNDNPGQALTNHGNGGNANAAWSDAAKKLTAKGYQPDGKPNMFGQAETARARSASGLEADAIRHALVGNATHDEALAMLEGPIQPGRSVGAMAVVEQVLTRSQGRSNRRKVNRIARKARKLSYKRAA